VSTDRITLFLLENRDYLRATIKQTFEDRDFRVLEAKGFEDGRTIIQKHGAEIDVLLLDMHLEGPETGADLARWIKDVLPDWPPEVIIHSGYDYVPYYQAALKIGASSYLRKGDFPDPKGLVHYARALALKRGLSPGRPDLEKVITQAAGEAAGGPEALWRFCGDVLGPELLRCTGAPCILLLSAAGETRCLGQGVQAPERSPIYEEIQARLFRAPGPVHPFRFEVGTEPWRNTQQAPADGGLAKLFESRSPVFMPLAEDYDTHLGLGIVPVAGSNGGGDEALELATAIHMYLRESLVRHQMRIAFAFAQESMKRKLLLELATGACLYTGQEIIDAVDARQGGDEERGDSVSMVLRDVRQLGEELLNEARALQSLEAWPATTAGPKRGQEEIAIAPFLRELWDQLRALGRVPAGGQLAVHDGITASANRGNLKSVFFRLLLWMAQRLLELPPEERSPILANMRAAGPWVEVVLEDRSPRLPTTLRQRLFSPFSASTPNLETPGRPGGRHLGLFLAKAIVETAEGGALLDQTEKLKGEQGHRIVVRLRRAGATTR